MDVNPWDTQDSVSWQKDSVSGDTHDGCQPMGHSRQCQLTGLCVWRHTGWMSTHGTLKTVSVGRRTLCLETHRIDVNPWDTQDSVSWQKDSVSGDTHDGCQSMGHSRQCKLTGLCVWRHTGLMSTHGTLKTVSVGRRSLCLETHRMDVNPWDTQDSVSWQDSVSGDTHDGCQPMGHSR